MSRSAKYHGNLISHILGLFRSEGIAADWMSKKQHGRFATMRECSGSVKDWLSAKEEDELEEIVRQLGGDPDDAY